MEDEVLKKIYEVFYKKHYENHLKYITFKDLYTESKAIINDDIMVEIRELQNDETLQAFKIGLKVGIELKNI